MKAKEKAEELFKKMYQVRSVSPSDITKYFAKQCALVAVDEIIKLDIFDCNDDWSSEDTRDYWKEVKQEIEKL